MMLGSQRIMLDRSRGERAAASFEVRDVAPDVLLIGNIGLAQLTKAAVPDISNALDRVGANALAVHANSLQEAIQGNGDTDFTGSLQRLCDVAGALDCPLLLKEVGHGIGARAVALLTQLPGGLPVSGIDVAGAGAPRGRESSSWFATANCATRTWPTGASRQPRRSSRCAKFYRRFRLSAPAVSAPGWTRPKRSPWVRTWLRWLVRCWLPRLSPRMPSRTGCNGSSRSFASACTAVAQRISMRCAPSA
ncbi:putative isopentenyl-diphosphate delta-isomerase [Mycobacterium kansasii 732]|nr:putative isopentenyl-diphosphate delta-isomerase [Mycobacterium kansasii 732]